MIPGSRPAKPQELTRVSDRLTFLYLQHCTISRDSNAVTATDERGTVHIPAALISAILLGPGTRVSHQAMALLGDSGASAVWVGENGVRFYSSGQPIARTARLAVAQADLVSNEKKRIAVARTMYAMRFPDEEVSHLTMQQLRGREGARVRSTYRDLAREHGIEWKRREYRPDQFEDGDEINQALTAAHTALYGLVHSVIAALGCSPALGFVHNGNFRSFVYDIADLYKTKTSIPCAFEIAASGNPDIATAVRYSMRDKFAQSRLLETCVRDIQQLLLGAELSDESALADVVMLWDPIGSVAAGSNYSDEWDLS